DVYKRQVVGTNSNLTLSPSSLGNTTQNWLGRSQYAADAYLDGQLDDFRIYNRALNAAEISSLAAGGSGL
ncbi:MAG: LamG domain-containing protein, partial [Anaerolineae bacterium]|nr:LamG domain-containing protein [Anaerolineae bacterium]